MQQLQEFHQFLNATNPNIKLSLDFNDNEIHFLDLKIFKDSVGLLHTSIFRKETDRNTILRADSCHPSSLISNIPFGQFQRLRRICDSRSDFETQSRDMYRRFQQRGYGKRTLNRAIRKARSMDRVQLFRKKVKTKIYNRIFCPMRHSSITNQVKCIIRNNWDILKSDPSLNSIFSEPPLFAVRRAPTLKDQLVKNYLPAQRKSFFIKPIGTFQCGSCNHCGHINKSTTFTDSVGKRTFTCRHFANCNTTHVIYRLDCSCGAFYIGRTKRRLKDRFSEHKYAIRTQNPNYPMAQHFKSLGHTNINQLTVMAIEVIPPNIRGGDRLKLLSQRETYWIVTLKATQYPGINDDLDFSVFL